MCVININVCIYTHTQTQLLLTSTMCTYMLYNWLFFSFGIRTIHPYCWVQLQFIFIRHIIALWLCATIYSFSLSVKISVDPLLLFFHIWCSAMFVSLQLSHRVQVLQILLGIHMDEEDSLNHSTCELWSSEYNAKPFHKMACIMLSSYP